jgi:parvulin-like peptidyl-prolyl isomerase
MLLDEVAVRLNLTPAQLERESLRVYLERRLRLVESELFTLAQQYGVNTVDELDQAIRAGRFHETETFEDFFRFDYLEAEIDSLQELLARL